MRGFEGFSDLLGERQGLVELNHPTLDAPREILAVDEFHDEGADVAGVIQGRQRLRFAREARQATGTTRRRGPDTRRFRALVCQLVCQTAERPSELD